jgi:hypothetical protein
MLKWDLRRGVFFQIKRRSELKTDGSGRRMGLAEKAPERWRRVRCFEERQVFSWF